MINKLGFFRWLMVISILALQTSCLTYKDVEIGEFKGYQLNHFGKDGIELTAQVEISNPNNYAITITDTDLKLALNGKPMGDANLSKNLRLPRKSKEVHDITIKAKFDGSLGSMITGLLGIFGGGKAEIAVTGTVKAKARMLSKTIPVDLKENISLK